MSQTDILREMFRAKPGQWLPLPELAEAMGGFAVHSRVAQLRRESGMVIVNRQEIRPGTSKRLSFYRYLTPEQLAQN